MTRNAGVTGRDLGKTEKSFLQINVFCIQNEVSIWRNEEQRKELIPGAWTINVSTFSVPVRALSHIRELRTWGCTIFRTVPIVTTCLDHWSVCSESHQQLS